MSVAERVAAAEAAVSALRAQIIAAQAAVKNGQMQDAVPHPPPLPPRISAMRCQRTLAGHGTKVTALSWGANSQYLASTCQEGRVVLWDSWEGVQRRGVSMKSSWVMTVCLDQQCVFFLFSLCVTMCVL